jgi:coenzyme F420-reducing hydrogenase delta subunit
LEDIGLGAKRIRMFNLSSAMGGQFATSAEEMAAEIEKLGPNPMRLNGKDTDNDS